MEYGLIAEEVAKVYPDLVAYGADGKIETVQYHKLTPMLLNELQRVDTLLAGSKNIIQKHEQTIQQQAQEIANLKSQMVSLKAQANTVVQISNRLTRLEAQQTVALSK